MSRLEKTSVPFEVKSFDEGGGTVEGLAACFNNIDNGKDLIKSGAYSQYLNQFRMEGKVRDEHSVTTGRIVDASETKDGLYIKGQIVDTVAGQDQLKLLRHGVINRLSIGHYVTARSYLETPEEVKSYWASVGYQPSETDLTRAGMGIRLIESARPVEVSSTYLPMNEKCAVTGVKSDGKPAGLTFDAHSESALATLEEYHDRARRLVEKRGAEGRTLSRKHLAAFRRLADHLLDLIGPDEKADAADLESKGALPYRDTPIASDAWDADAAQERLKAWADGDMAKYREGFAWYDSGKPDEMGSYKLPIRDIHDGKLVTNIHAVSAALAAVNGARGGVDIPEADKAKVAAVLDRYRKKAGVGEDNQGKADDAPETKDDAPAVATPEPAPTPESAPESTPESKSENDTANPAEGVAPDPTADAAAPTETPATEAATTKTDDATPGATTDAGTPAQAAPDDNGAASPPPAPTLVDASHLFAEFQAILAKTTA